MAEPIHIPVILQECLALLGPRPGDTVVDCTAGRGGHAEALAGAIGPDGTLVLIDLDAGNLETARRHVESKHPDGPQVHAVHGSFGLVHRHLEDLDLRADVVLADLGFSSTQMDDPERGMSFRQDAPLDMRFDTSKGPTAAQILESSSEDELEEMIRDFGEEPLARRIAQKVVRARDEKPIEMTGQLTQLVREAYGRRAATARMDPATRTFMALRIAVNDELVALDALLAAIVYGAEARTSVGWLNQGARIGIISFHSLEDRPVKRAFADLTRRMLATHLTKGPLRASPEEERANRRSRSAKLRVVELT
ncbi:MAG: 16S rRNA (cytosine(1402)-N(4))-methyltransferase [Phycisphaerae bacterium]|nr:16S rRNA (cytosine(1402)-N(4))-methyltransferase [Phycisphaerae bacterium]MDG1898914.1 16S rRNA (cytosine(1402)-N(4))-methyltransferase RsmH [Phycisphaerales bacterium]|tara:strand:+ start:846 stop:1772 length:927 start_codon:yes stop_codon:yes gene_type:complete